MVRRHEAVEGGTHAVVDLGFFHRVCQTKIFICDSEKSI